MRKLLAWMNGASPIATSPEFQQEMTRAILKSEMLRIRALIITTTALAAVLWTIYIIAPEEINAIWHGNLKPAYLYIILVPFVTFELVVYRLVKHQLALDHDVPVVRRYISAFIETSMPTIALALHIDNMGSTQALGFVVPLAYFIFIILSTLRLDFWLSTFTGLVASVELFLMAIYYHPAPDVDASYQLARCLIIFVCGMLAGAVGVRLRRQFERSIAAVTARDRITNLFGQHVSPQVVERLLAEGTQTTSDMRRVAVMFVDFRSFTSEAKSRSPQEVVDRLDGAFAVLVDVLDRHGGIVNKFLGDGFLALFGVPFETPDAAQRAVAAAREMLAVMDENNSGADWQLRIGIGLHVGEVVAGNIGSPRRKEYTVIGDTVNLASRIEALNKQFGSQFLISSVVRDDLGEAAADAELIGDVPIRGYDQPMPIWRFA